MQEDDDVEQEHPVRNLVLSVCDLKQHGDSPAAKCGAQMVTMGLRIYLYGGCDEAQVYGDLHLLEIEQMKWTQLTATGDAPSPRWGHAMEAHGTDVVVFGGLASDGGGLLADAPPSVPSFAAGLQWNHSGSLSNSVHLLQTESLTWQAVACAGTPPSARLLHGSCMVGDQLAIFGGSADAAFSAPLNDLHLLDMKSKQWSTPNCGGQPPSPRFSAKVVAGPNNQLFVFGGTGAGQGEVRPGTLYGFSLDTATWATVQVAGTPPLERAFHSFDAIGKWAFAFAGSTFSSISDLYLLDIPNMRWTRPLYDSTINLRAHAASVLSDKLIVFGGVRDKVSEPSKKGPPTSEPRISRKLFFLNVLEVKTNASEGDYKFKLVTVGDSGVGKSCLLTRFVQDFYSDFHVSTIGVDFKTVVTMVRGRLVKLQLWDTAGQEKFSVITGNYYRNSDGFVFVYDATNRASFDHVANWINLVKEHHELGPDTIKILVGNKADMTSELVVSEEEGRAKAESLGALFIATSAKTAVNVDMAFLSAAQSLVDIRGAKKKAEKQSLGPGGPTLDIRAGAGGGDREKKAKCAGCAAMK